MTIVSICWFKLWMVSLRREKKIVQVADRGVMLGWFAIWAFKGKAEEGWQIKFQEIVTIPNIQTQWEIKGDYGIRM